MFEIKNVTKRYGEECALSNISMTIGKGLNFIIGSSGSGKTTLLKIISGMEQKFEGEVLYNGKGIKNLSEKEKSSFYNGIFGFVWQDFNLLDELTVLDNVMLPWHLKEEKDRKTVLKILRELKISELANQKVGNLSGGQKQRVAIARELIKNPKVIIADEPTSALDEKSSLVTMDILREIAKDRTVIVVTHDTSLIDSKSNVYELDKGELVEVPEVMITKPNKLGKVVASRLNLRNAFQIAKMNIGSKKGRFATNILALIVAATLLLVTASGAISGSSQSVFDELYRTYGKSILDISVVGSFMSAGGTDGSNSEEPSANVTQDIDGLYDKYVEDERVSHIVLSQAFNEIRVTADNKEYQIETSNSVPSVNELTAGVMPMGQDNEVVIPNSFVKKLGLKDKEVLGKVITFNGTIYNWDSGEPVPMPVNTTAKVVGVVDTTVKYDVLGEVMEYTVDDSFFFSKSALDEMRAQANNQQKEVNFTIRAKTPADMITIKDELNAMGIVPIGRFELVEDMVRLNEQTNEQSGSAILVIGFLSIVIILVIAMITSLTRKREYAIYKVCGYNRNHLALIMTVEYITTSILTGILFVCISPLTNLATKSLWSVNIVNVPLLCTGVLFVFAMGCVSCIVALIVSGGTKITSSLKTGER